MSLTVSPPLIQQLQPRFIGLRKIYESRERNSKIYNWFAFVCAAVLPELPWTFIAATIYWACWYWPTGFPRDSFTSAALWLFVWLFGVSHDVFVLLLAFQKWRGGLTKLSGAADDRRATQHPRLRWDLWQAMAVDCPTACESHVLPDQSSLSLHISGQRVSPGSSFVHALEGIDIVYQRSGGASSTMGWCHRKIPRDPK